MKFKFNNYSRFTGKSRGKYQYYEWKVFMNEPPEMLEKARSVEYRLHKTFPNRIRIIDDRESQYALKSTGWGNFWINIIVYLMDGTEIRTKYYLNLGKPWPIDD